MFKRRRGVIVKCAALIAAFWIGFAIYLNSVPRADDYGRRSAPEHRGAELVVHHVMRPSDPIGQRTQREDDRVKRDRELQEQFRRDQTKLRELLDGRKAAAVSTIPAADLQKYDPQTASLIRLGLIVPKWNISEERPEHLGAPGTIIMM